MSKLQTKINGDGTVSVIIPTLSHPLYGISIDQIDQLPSSLSGDQFCASAVFDKAGWELRSITFDKPADEVRRIKKIVEAISDYIVVEKLKAQVELKYSMLLSDQQKREKELLELRKKVKTPPAPPKEGVEYVANLPVDLVIKDNHTLDPETPTTDGYNRLLVETFDRLPQEDKAGNPSLIKAMFVGYYLTSSGLKKVELEFNL